MEKRLNLPQVRKYLGIDVGIAFTAFVRKEGTCFTNYGGLQQTTKFKSMEVLQDNLLNYLDSAEGRKLWEGVDVVGVERHWRGNRPTMVSSTLNCLEFTLRLFFMFHGINVIMVPAASYKRMLKQCTGTYKDNKVKAGLYALEKLEGVKVNDNELKGRIHDYGDAAMICDYLTQKQNKQ